MLSADTILRQRQAAAAHTGRVLVRTIEEAAAERVQLPREAMYRVLDAAAALYMVSELRTDSLEADADTVEADWLQALHIAQGNAEEG